jgi:hypothetical protein
MKNNRLPWKLISRYLAAAVGVAMLWRVSPVLAGILSMVMGLCAIAYWGDNAKSASPKGSLSLEEFKQRLQLTASIKN